MTLKHNNPKTNFLNVSNWAVFFVLGCYIKHELKYTFEIRNAHLTKSLKNPVTIKKNLQHNTHNSEYTSKSISLNYFRVCDLRSNGLEPEVPRSKNHTELKFVRS